MPHTPRQTADRGNSPSFEIEDSARVKALVKQALFGKIPPNPAGTAAPSSSAQPSAPLQIGRFAILRRLGAGGMGVVYAARDDTLHRTVAVKLLRRNRDERARRALRLEAQAAARLSHPNVVTVYEVGAFEERVYMAMEYVDGCTLADPDFVGALSFQQKLGLYIQAGEGLAAAHRSGLVHRDFKPANVAVDREGRARVLDFGLAHIATDEAASANAAEGVAPYASSLAGTPAYMAPEQWLGAAADRAADQFSYCVALYEALFASHPFGSADGSIDHDAVLAGRLSSLARVPRGGGRVHRILVRGLSLKPGDRWPSLDALMEALRRAAGAPRRRTLWALGGGAVLVLGLSGFVAFRAAIPEPCSDSGAAFAGVWDEQLRTRVLSALRKTSAPYAQETYKQVASTLDQRVHAWTELHQQTCRAHLQGALSNILLDERMACLRTVRRETASFVKALSQADVDLAERAVQAASDLTEPARCEQDALLRTRLPVPPTAKQAVDANAFSVAEARAARIAGAYEKAVQLSQEALTTARALGYRPALVAALVTHGEAQESAGALEAAVATLEEAYEIAVNVGADNDALRASTQLAAIVGKTQGDFAAGQAWGKVALAFAGRDDIADSAGSHAQRTMGSVYDRARKTDKAVPHLELALALERTRDPQGIGVASALNALGVARTNLSQFEASQVALDEALLLHENLLGKMHPETSKVLTNLGNLALARRDFATSIAHFGACLRARSAALGDAHVLTGRAEANLGVAYLRAAQFESAALHLERSLANLTVSRGPQDWSVGLVLGQLGEVWLAQDKPREAVAFFQRGIAIDENTLGKDHPDVGHSVSGLGMARLVDGDLEGARAALERALTLLGESSDHGAVARIHDGLARALWELGRDRTRSVTLARAAHDEYLAAADHTKAEAVAQWLDTVAHAPIALAGSAEVKL